MGKEEYPEIEKIEVNSDKPEDKHFSNNQYREVASSKFENSQLTPCKINAVNSFSAKNPVTKKTQYEHWLSRNNRKQIDQLALKREFRKKIQARNREEKKKNQNFVQAYKRDGFSKSRQTSIRQFFQTTGRIQTTRKSAKTRCLPPVPSTPKFT